VGRLLAKDARILRRSPLTVAILVIYPVVVALLVGLALSRPPERPEVAVVGPPPGEAAVQIGGQELDLALAERELRDRVDAVRVSSRDEAARKVREGDVLGALVIPSVTEQRLRSTLDRPQVEVLVNEEDPLRARAVRDAIESAVAGANQRVSRALTSVAVRYLRLLQEGGSVNVLGNEFSVLGLDRIAQITRRAARRLPPDSAERRDLEQVSRFATLARQNFNLSGRALNAISQPIRVKTTAVAGSEVELTDFAAAVAAAISLMFLCVLLASGALALEREENVIARLLRGPVRPAELLAEKMLLTTVAASAVTALLLALLGTFVDLDWERAALWAPAVIAGALAFSALGVLIGALAREVAAASLASFALLLPLAFAGLIPAGSVSDSVHDVTTAISAAFPFKPTLDAFTAALYGSGDLVGPLLHLALLAAVFAVAARVAVRRPA
jgi:ABC-2 type transport system permease protein